MSQYLYEHALDITFALLAVVLTGGLGVVIGAIITAGIQELIKWLRYRRKLRALYKFPLRAKVRYCGVGDHKIEGVVVGYVKYRPAPHLQIQDKYGGLWGIEQLYRLHLVSDDPREKPILDYIRSELENV